MKKSKYLFDLMHKTIKFYAFLRIPMFCHGDDASKAQQPSATVGQNIAEVVARLRAYLSDGKILDANGIYVRNFRGKP